MTTVYPDPTLVGLPPLGQPGLKEAELIPAAAELLHLVYGAAHLPEQEVGADLHPGRDGDVPHLQIILSHLEEFQLKPLTYTPHFALTASKLTLENEDEVTSAVLFIP